MSIATQISRIESNRNTIRDKLVELGMATTTDKLDTLAAAIENIINRGAVSVTVQEGDTYTIPAGYHNGLGTVSGVAGGGDYNLQSKTATPTKKQQSITPDSGYYGLSDVTVDAIPDSYVQPTKTGTVTTNGTYNVMEYKSLTVNVESSGSSLPTSTLDAISSIGGTLYYIDENGQGQSIVRGDIFTVPRGSYFILDWAGMADGYYLDGCEIVRAYGPVETTVGDGEEYYVMILKITGDYAFPMI